MNLARFWPLNCKYLRIGLKIQKSPWCPKLYQPKLHKVLSPDFYSIYVDELIEILKHANKGCYLHHSFAAALFYADNMAIMAPTIKALASLLQLCGEYCLKWDIGLNASKSRNLYFGK